MGVIGIIFKLPKRFLIMKKLFLKAKSWKIMLWGTIFQLFYALSILIYLFVSNYFNLKIGSSALGLILIMIYSAIFSLVGIIFLFLFFIKNKIIKKILSILTISLGVIGLILSFIPEFLFIPLSIFLIWSGILSWKEGKNK